jgi:chemotaxis protein CheD
MSQPATNRFMARGDSDSVRRIVVGIGEMAVTDRPDDVLVTYALGSCVAVCLFDQVSRVAAMLHFLLPESSINARRAIAQPAAFADTGIPLLLETAVRRGLKKSRTSVRLVGGAMVANTPGPTPATGHRNALAARSILWRLGLFIEGQDVGGVEARTVHFAAGDGRLLVVSGRQTKEI